MGFLFWTCFCTGVCFHPLHTPQQTGSSPTQGRNPFSPSFLWTLGLQVAFLGEKNPKVVPSSLSPSPAAWHTQGGHPGWVSGTLVGRELGFVEPEQARLPQGREPPTRRALGWCLNPWDVSHLFLAGGPRAWGTRGGLGGVGEAGPSLMAVCVGPLVLMGFHLKNMLLQSQNLANLLPILSPQLSSVQMTFEVLNQGCGPEAGAHSGHVTA